MSGEGPTTNEDFVTGAAPASLVPLRVSTSVVHISFSNLTNAIYHAADNGHHVVSMSLGGPIWSLYLRRAIRYAVDRGVILLAAAGNVWPWVVYPAAFDEVVAVAACNCRRRTWASSASGPAVNVTAPGESVWNALAERVGDSRVTRGSGTSFAVATTAGICALWLAFHGRQRLIDKYGRANLASVFKELLMQAVVRPSGWDTRNFGTGIVNAHKLLRMSLPDTSRATAFESLDVDASPADGSDFERFCGFFPNQEPSQVRAATLSLLGTDERNLPAKLHGVCDELCFHVATNPAFRERIMRMAAGRMPRAATASSIIGRNTAFEKGASKTLKSALNRFD